MMMLSELGQLTILLQALTTMTEALLKADGSVKEAYPEFEPALDFLKNHNKSTFVPVSEHVKEGHEAEVEKLFYAASTGSFLLGFEFTTLVHAMMNFEDALREEAAREAVKSTFGGG